MNALFQHADYISPGARRKLVHGSYMRAAYFTIITNASRALHAEYAASRPLSARVSVDGEQAPDMALGGRSQITVDDVGLSLEGRTLRVRTPKWFIGVSSKVTPSILGAKSCATGRCILNVRLAPRFDTKHAKVAPHGLIGQSYDADDIAVIGKVGP